MPYNQMGQWYDPPPTQEQAAAQSGPQGMQNYLQSLHNQPMSSMNNMQMNQLGMTGASPQAGFTGFQQNGFNPYNQLGTFQSQGNAMGNPMQSTAPPPSSDNVARNGIFGQVGATQHGQQATSPNFGLAGAMQIRLPGQPAPYGQLGTQQSYQPQLNGAPMSQTVQPMPLPTAPQKQFQNFAPAERMPVQMPQQNQFAMSDETQKTEIAPAEGELQEFLNALNAYSYEYKDKQFGAGEYVSPMAQELEQSKIGKSAVIETPHGKMVDYGRISGVQLAATAMMNHKINALEKKITTLLREKMNAKR